jgi:hypothetical protein
MASSIKKNDSGTGEIHNTKKQQMIHNGSTKLLYVMASAMMVIIIGMAGTWAMQINRQLAVITTQINDVTTEFVRKDELAMVFAAQADVISKQVSKMHETSIIQTRIFERIVTMMEANDR